MPKTAAINADQYTDHFNSLLADHDAVVHICLSSQVSSACSHAKDAASEMDNVFVVDSQSLSTGIALLAIYARQLADAGVLPDEICQKVQDRTSKVQASFVVERLDYLYKGGRCNSLAYFGANLLKIRPQIVVSEGKMKSAKKYRGKIEKVIKDYCADTLAEFNTPDKKVAFITHTTATPEMVENAKKAMQEIDEEFKQFIGTIATGDIFVENINLKNDIMNKETHSFT